jgi:hypothetical protein
LPEGSTAFGARRSQQSRWGLRSHPGNFLCDDQPPPGVSGTFACCWHDDGGVGPGRGGCPSGCVTPNEQGFGCFGLKLAGLRNAILSCQPRPKTPWTRVPGASLPTFTHCFFVGASSPGGGRPQRQRDPRRWPDRTPVAFADARNAVRSNASAGRYQSPTPKEMQAAAAPRTALAAGRRLDGRGLNGGHEHAE